MPNVRGFSIVSWVSWLLTYDSRYGETEEEEEDTRRMSCEERRANRESGLCCCCSEKGYGLLTFIGHSFVFI